MRLVSKRRQTVMLPGPCFVVKTAKHIRHATVTTRSSVQQLQLVLQCNCCTEERAKGTVFGEHDVPTQQSSGCIRVMRIMYTLRCKISASEAGSNLYLNVKLNKFIQCGKSVAQIKSDVNLS